MLRWISFLILASFFTVSQGCAEKTDSGNIDTENSESSNSPPRKYFKEYAGPHDTLKLIRDNLYDDEKGELYFDAPFHAENRSIYLKYEGVPDPENTEPTKLTTIIDRGSWHHIFDSFYADKTSLYCHYAMSDGGNIGRVRGAVLYSISVIIIDTDTDTWRKVAADKFERSSLSEKERAWHITDGNTVIGVRCANQGLLSEWNIEKAFR